jgi:cell division inhibitor SulA/protein ImuA
MRAATALASLLKPGAAPVWQASAIGPDGSATVSSGFAALDAELPGHGWPQGQLVELLLDVPGVGELSLLAPALAHLARDRPCVWVLPCDGPAARGAALPYPPALAAAGVAVERSIFVQPATPRESLWALEQSLRTAHLGALVGWLPASSARDADFRTMRRLHLLAQKHRALVFLLRGAGAAEAASPASLRLRLACTDGQLRITVLKRRGWPLLEPVTLQVHPAHWNESRVQTQMPAPPDTPERIVVPGTPALPARHGALQSVFSH